MTYAELSRVDRNGTPGAEGSMGRIFHGELGQRVRLLAMDVLGPDALVDEAGRPAGLGEGVPLELHRDHRRRDQRHPTQRDR